MKILSLFKKPRSKKYKEYSRESANQASQRPPYKIEDHVPMHDLDSTMNNLSRNFRTEGIMDQEAALPKEEGKKRIIHEFESGVKQVTDMITGCNQKFQHHKAALEKRLKEFALPGFLETYLATDESYHSEKKALESDISKCSTDIKSAEDRLKLYNLTKKALRKEKYGGAWGIPDSIHKQSVYNAIMAAFLIIEAPINYPAIQIVSGDMDLFCLLLTGGISLMISLISQFLGSSIYYNKRNEIVFLSGLLVLMLIGIGVLRTIGGNSLLVTALGFIIAALSTYFAFKHTPHSLYNTIEKTEKKILNSKQEFVAIENDIAAMKVRHSKIAEQEFSNLKADLEEEIHNTDQILIENQGTLVNYLDKLQNLKCSAMDSYESGYNSSIEFSPKKHRFNFNGSAIVILLAILIGSCGAPTLNQSSSEAEAVLIDITDEQTVSSQDILSGLDLNRKEYSSGRKIIVSTISEISVNKIWEFILPPPKPFPFESQMKRRAEIQRWKTTLTRCIDSVVNISKPRPLSKIGRAIQGCVDFMRAKGIQQFKLLLVSDMITNQFRIDFYQYKANADSLVSNSAKMKDLILKDSPLNLAGVNIHIMGKPPAHLDDLIRAGHTLWTDALTSSGAESVLITAN